MKKYSFLLFLVLFLFSCEKDEPSNPIPETDGPIYYISNEGAFGFGNGSVSMYYPKENKMVNDAFKEANGRRPGDVLQSISTVNGKVYMIVNASNKIEIAATKTLKEIGVIQHLSLPRYMEVTSNSRAYISIWGNGGKLMVMDLLKDEIIDSIEVGNGPEKMLSTDGKLFVCNSGGFGEDSILTVIDQAQNKVVTELAVGDNPTDIVKGMSGTIWVLCKGKVLYDANWQIIGHTPSYLVQTNMAAQSILKKVKISDNQHPSHLEISPDGKYLYYGAGYGFSGIYRYDITNNSIDPTVFINRDFYGFNVEPSTGDIYGLEATSFTVSGKMLRYAADGSLKNDFTVGVGPNGVCF
jgi:hypothetical protein